MRVISASSMERTAACSAWLHLPGEDEPGEAAKRGTAIHEFLRNAVKLGRDAALELVPSKYRGYCEKIDLAALMHYIEHDGIGTEQALEFEPDNEGAQFINVEGRDYPGKRGHVYGTVDLIIWRAGYPEVIDYKTGESVGYPDANWQMRMLGLMVARAVKARHVKVGIVYVSKEKGREGKLDLDVASLSAMDLDTIADDVRGVMGRVNEANTAIGDWCRWCPCKPNCPAHKVA